MWKYVCANILKTKNKLFPIMSILQTHYHFKLDFLKMDQNIIGKLLINGTNFHKTISCKVWKLSVEYPCRESRHDIKRVRR